MHKQTIKISIVTLAFLFAAIVCSGQELSVRELKKLSKEGNTDAKYQLGLLYYHGDDIKQDVEKAYVLIERSALDGNFEAIMWMIEFEESQEQVNHKIIYHWTVIAAETGDAEAVYNLSNLHRDGNGTEVNKFRAHSYCEEAAILGSVDAQYEYASMLQSGYASEKNEAEAVLWFDSAALNGHIEAQLLMADKYFVGKGVDIDKKKSEEYYLKAAKQDDDIAQLCLSYIYSGKCGMEPDSVSYEYWVDKLLSDKLERIGVVDLAVDSNRVHALKIMSDLSYLAAEKDQNIAKLGLWTRYFYYFEFAPNLEEAYMFLNEAAEAGDPYSQYCVASYQPKIKGLDHSDSTLFNYARNGALYGYSEAECLLGMYYHYGFYKRKNENKAAFWYEKSAEGNYLTAFVKLGDLYSDTKRLSKEWYTKACERNNSYSCMRLVELELYSKDSVIQEESYSICKKAIELGDKEAVFYLAYKQYHGHGVKVDYESAYKNFQISASDSIIESLYYLAIMNIEGKGIAEDFRKGMEILEISIEYGDPEARLYFADLINNGKIEGVKRDECIKYYKEMADEGYFLASCRLGYFYYKGELVDKDTKKAFRYLDFGRSADESGKSDYLVALMICESDYQLGYKSLAYEACSAAIYKGYEPAVDLWKKYELDNVQGWH